MSADEHELVVAVKNLALELGRSPTRQEFEARIVGANYKLNRFGGFTALLKAAGLESYDERRSGKKLKISAEALFGRDIAETVQAHEPKRVESTSADFKPILAVGDTHFPFAHHPTLEKIYRFAEKEQPAFIVQMGDLQDQFSHSRFPTSRNIYSPDQEMELGRKQAVEFWSELKRACPNAVCYQITGNHDVRALRLVLQAAPTLESLVRESITKLYEFEGVKTIHDYREELVIQDIMFHHGYFSRHGQARDFVMQNIVTAHTHKGAVVYRALKDRTIWHLDAGYTGDPEAKVMSYTPQKTLGYTLGWGWVDKWGARFIPA